MKDAEKFELAKAGLKFCPECGTTLDQHANNVTVMACFRHGDFMLVWVEGDLQVRWRATRMASAYLVKKGDKTDQLKEVAGRYAKMTISFLEATQWITEIETGEFPSEPTLLQRRRAREVLDRLTREK
jgi:hypothetical protein